MIVIVTSTDTFVYSDFDQLSVTSKKLSFSTDGHFIVFMLDDVLSVSIY